MTARKDKTKGGVSEEMAFAALTEEDSPGEANTVEQRPEQVGKGLRRPVEPREGNGRLGGLEQIARIAASIGVAGAAIIGVIEYISNNEDIRRERSFAVVHDWQDDELVERYTRLQAYVEEQLATSTLPPASLPPPALAQAYRNLGYNWMLDLRADGGTDAQAVETDVDRLTLFFVQMEICIASDLCNADVLNAYFHSEVITFWQYFQGYARLRREANYAEYGRPIDKLVTRFLAMGQK